MTKATHANVFARVVLLGDYWVYFCKTGAKIIARVMVVGGFVMLYKYRMF